MTESKYIKRDREDLLKRSGELAAELNEQQREFCQAYLICDTGTAAAEMAGYSNPRVKASKLLADERIEEYINVLQQLRELASALDATQLVSMQMETYFAAREKSDLKAANTALDQLGKMIGAYNRDKGKTAGEEPEKLNKEEEADIVDLIKKVRERSAVQLDNVG